jgi:hypothetical protein
MPPFRQHLPVTDLVRNDEAWFWAVLREARRHVWERAASQAARSVVGSNCIENAVGAQDSSTGAAPLVLFETGLPDQLAGGDVQTVSPAAMSGKENGAVAWSGGHKIPHSSVDVEVPQKSSISKTHCSHSVIALSTQRLV